MRVIAGKARRLQLKTVPGLDTRPTTDRIKETLFNILQPELLDCRFLDLFSGSGGIGIEALSRGAQYAVFVEKNPKACACIRENLSFTKLAENGKLLNMDVLQALRSLEHKGVFDCVFMDPPYQQELERQVLEYLRESSIIDENTLIIVEADLKTDFSYAEDLGYCLLRSKEYKTNKHVFLKKLP
ncbi:16S rRNA (guanine(966)-N(2))-methyltransferase RsmD [Blautia sp. HCP3S3_G3]|uniref:16S rRNA (guanine(966)-N(2))-methyltransferase RsmD n=1 Tax=Blautia sp. HCP3S3_G3 TaxID=3438913 RepID=UPI003F88F6C9